MHNGFLYGRKNRSRNTKFQYFWKFAGYFIYFYFLNMPGLYIHTPFCKQKCAYCDFFSNVTDAAGSNIGRDAAAGLIPGYLEAFGREILFRRNAVPGGRLDTIYIGGGTPSLLSPEQLQSLLDRAAELWDCTVLQETTVEANPEDLTKEYLARLTDTGIDRLSIGIQSFDDAMLRSMNRRHSAQRALDAVRTAQKAGFGNITIDLIYGIPGMTHGQWEKSLDKAVGLGVQHISAYHLTIEPGTLFGRMAREGKIAAIPEKESERQYDTLRRKLGNAGFEHYEISNFALPGFRAIHNSAYWSGESYLGVGPSAHSYDGRMRNWAVADIAEYIKGAGTAAIYESETLSATDLWNEFIMTSLRRAEGIDAAKMERRFGCRASYDFMKRAEVFVKNGKLREADGRIFIPPENFLLSDYIISTLFALR